MALKTDWQPLEWNVGYFTLAASERGGIVVSATGSTLPGSGGAMDHYSQRAEYAANGSGRYPLGILFNTFVNKDLTQQTLNYLKGEAQVGDKASIVKKGHMTTNFIVGATSVVPGQPAYLGATGTITPTYTNDVATPRIGRFESRPDQNGYCKIYVDC